MPLTVRVFRCGRGTCYLRARRVFLRARHAHARGRERGGHAHRSVETTVHAAVRARFQAHAAADEPSVRCVGRGGSVSRFALAASPRSTPRGLARLPGRAAQADVAVRRAAGRRLTSSLSGSRSHPFCAGHGRPSHAQGWRTPRNLHPRVAGWVSSPRGFESRILRHHMFWTARRSHVRSSADGSRQDDGVRQVGRPGPVGAGDQGQSAGHGLGEDA